MPSQNVCLPKREYCGQCGDLEEIVEVKYRCRWNLCFMRPSDTCPCKPSHFNKAARSNIPGDLIFSASPWEIYRQDAGMGEHDYAVFVDGVFYCRTDDIQTATKIVNSVRMYPKEAAHV